MTCETPRRRWRVPANKKEEHGFAHIEKIFYYYHKIVEAVKAIRDEQGFYNHNTGSNSGNTSHASISDPTAAFAMKRYSPIRKVVINADRLNESVILQPEEWIKVVRQTLSYYENINPQVVDVLKDRFFKNESIAKTCERMGITQDKYYRLRDAGVRYARECAIQIGLIKVF